MNLYPWQKQSFEHLWRYKTQSRIPQALLIIGKKGIGKLHLARQFASSLLCSNPDAEGMSCEKCSSCLLFKAQTHPDFITISPEGTATTIAIDQIRKLTNSLTLKPQFDQFRIVILNPADQMNIKSANAFLKYLEEPTERTIVILLTEKPNLLPATIISRCQKLFIDTPAKEVTAAWLRQQSIIDDPEVLISLAQGAPLLAADYARENYVTMRDECFKDFIAVAENKIHPVTIAEKWQKNPESFLIFCLSTWITDLIKCSYHIQIDSMYNPDLYKQFLKLAQHLKIRELYQLYDLLLASRKYLNTQVNKQALFDEILIRWSDSNRSK